MVLLNMARQYRDAATELFLVSERRPKVNDHRAMGDPINFLYFHTIELALKAFLRSHGRQIRSGHKLTKIYEQCKKLGLAFDPQHRSSVESIVYLSERGNEGHGFRYFTPGSAVTADLAWTREGVAALMRDISPQIEGRHKDDGTRSVAKMIVVVHKPR